MSDDADVDLRFVDLPKGDMRVLSAITIGNPNEFWAVHRQQIRLTTRATALVDMRKPQ